MKSKIRKLSTIVGNISSAELSHITVNLKTSMVRNARMEGRDYKVAPMVMILEGVHNGSQGALYYPSNEIKKAVSLWDHKPIVVYHPTVNGKGVSACSPDVLTAQKVGVILNTKVDFNGPDKTARLVAEAWIEKDRASMVDKRVIQSINNQKTMELSTGLFMDVQNVENGEWKGEKYDAIARNYRPDHLALLPDKEGACSTKDGAGFIRNQKDGDEEDPNMGDEQENTLLPRDATIESDEEDDNDADDPIDLGLMDNAKPDDASKAALNKSTEIEEHVRNRGEKANADVVGLITKAGSFANRAVSAQSSQMAAIYHTKAARTYDKAHIANYRSKGPVKTSILAAKAGTAHYDAASAHKGELTKNIEAYDDTKPKKKKSGDSGAMGQDAMIAGTIVGVTKANPSVKKKKPKGDQEQKISVMEKSNLLQKNKTLDGTLTGNATSQPKQNSMKLNKKQQVDALIGNQNSVWTEDEQDFLMSLNEKQIATLYDQSLALNEISEDNNGKVIGKSSDRDEDDDDTVDVDGSKTLGGKAKTKATTETECANGKMPPQFAKKKKAAMDDDEDDTMAKNESAEDYITNAPPEIRDILEEGLATRNAEKRQAIKTITANSANEFSKEELTAMPLKQLRSLAKLAANSVQEDEAPQTNNRTLNFGGQALVIENEETAKDEILALPTMNWSKDEIAANRGTKARSA